MQNQDEINDFIRFEGNAQGLRVVTQIENRKFHGGLKLTYSTLGTLIKYPWFSNHSLAQSKNKFNFYIAEKDIARDIFSNLGLYDQTTDLYSRHPLSYLMEAADDICYKVLDIEDGLELGLLRLNEVGDILEKLAGKHLIKKDIESDWSERRKIYYMRSRAIKNLISLSSKVFIRNYKSIMENRFEGDLVSKISGKEKEGIKESKILTEKNIFLSKRKIQLELGAYETISAILNSLICCINEHKSNQQVSFKAQRIKDLIGNNYFNPKDSYYNNYLLVTDQASGMTDDFASYTANQLRGVLK